MFTVKHIDRDGSEFAIEAESYEIRHDRKDGIVRILTYDNKHRDGNYTGFWVGVPCGMSLPENTIYIMNRTGSTIATAHFNEVPADHWGEPQAREDPTDKLAA